HADFAGTAKRQKDQFIMRSLGNTLTHGDRLAPQARKEHIPRRNKTQFTRSKTELQGTVRRETFECAIQCLTRQAHRDRAPEPLCALQPCFPNSGKAVLSVPNGEPACEGTIKRGERFLGRYCARAQGTERSEEHTSELQSREKLVCRLLLEKKKEKSNTT